MEPSLLYPLDTDEIIKKRKAIKRHLLQNSNHMEKKIAVLGGSTTAEIKMMLELFLLQQGIRPRFYESEYNKYAEDVLFANPELLAFQPDIIYLHTTSNNIQQLPGVNDAEEEIQQKLKDEFSRYQAIWAKIREIYKCAIIQNNFELSLYRPLGNLDFAEMHGQTNFIMHLNSKFAHYAQNNHDFYINDIHYLAALMGLDKWHNKALWYAYKYALSYEAIVLLSHNLAHIIKSIYGRNKKCLVLDLDNTLWGGVIADDGINHIQIGQGTAVAEAYTAFQQYLKQLKDRGVLLAVCSKNDHNNAVEGLTHPDNILTLDDFAAFKANWEPKPQNIRQIAAELNIGLDSMVFIDDNAVERELVKAQLPQVTVPDIGDNVINYIDFIDIAGYFEPIALSKDDKQRNCYYQENAQRIQLEAKYDSYADFLQSLQMKADINDFTPLYLERITQLTNKTNQFNLTTKRYTYSELEAIAHNTNYIRLYGKLSDKFGDNGLVSVIIGVVNDQQLTIELWIMSCRVLKREFEVAMFDKLVAVCLHRKIQKITGKYLKSAKNGMVADHYQTLGFTLTSRDEQENTLWEYDIPLNYQPRNCFVEVSDER
jgi:FkbH-like protein